jgi:rare lipoprotein A
MVLGQQEASMSLSASPAAAAAFLAALLLAACAHAPPPRADGHLAAPQPAIERGLASFYADGLQGRPTASGAPYDRRAFTCAHRSWPFGAVLRVTALDSGRSLEVKVTDRGPWVEGRVVDLSHAAAEALGMLGRGVIRVEIVRVR